MNMPLLKVNDYEHEQQLRKIGEELIELATACTRPGQLFEALDLITATSTLITHRYSKEDIEDAMKWHTKKLQSRGWETKGTIKIELEDEE